MNLNSPPDCIERSPVGIEARQREEGGGHVG